jgi:anti-anti-sigma factor
MRAPVVRDRKAIGAKGRVQMSGGRLAIEISPGGDRRTVVLKGELDVASAGLFESTLAGLCVEGARELVIDLGGVEFIDSTGINALLRAQMLCEEHVCGFHLRPARPTVHHAFEIARVLDRLPFRKPERAHELQQSGT